MGIALDLPRVLPCRELVMSGLKSIDDEETMAAVVRAMVEDGTGLKQALVAQGYAEGDVRHASARWRKAPGFQAAIAAAMDQALVEQGPMLLREAIRLALHAKSDFVRAEMLKWLLPQVKQDERQVSRAGGLTLNIYGCRDRSASAPFAGDTPVLDHEEAFSPMSLSVGEGGGG